MNPLDKVAAVTEYVLAHPYERDYWEKAPAITGILAGGDASAIEAIREWIDRAVETQTSNGDLNYAEALALPAGHTKTFAPTSSLPSSLGYPLLRFYEATKDPAYLEAADRQIDALLRTPRTSEGGFWARKEGPELWTDFLYMICPFLLLYARIKGRSELADEAFRQYEVHTKHLVDREHGLTRHAWRETPNSYPSSTFWARGNGWMVSCSVDMLDLNGKHPKAELVRETAVAALAAMAAKQDRSGFLRHVLDDPDEKFEASGTLMFAYAAARAVSLNLVDDSYIERAKRALTVVAGSVEPSGAIPGVAVPPGGPGVPFGSCLFGQGFYLLAAEALRKYLG
ncbi:MAG: glycoside hydrolase family 88 protein [Lautropia sp.]